MGAALSYYTVFSLAPLLVIGIAGLVFGEEAARGAIVEQLQGLIGDEGAKAINELIDNADKTGTGIVATIVGVVTLLFGAWVFSWSFKMIWIGFGKHHLEWELE
jgi:membrane protein